MEQISGIGVRLLQITSETVFQLEASAGVVQLALSALCHGRQAVVVHQGVAYKLLLFLRERVLFLFDASSSPSSSFSLFPVAPTHVNRADSGIVLQPRARPCWLWPSWGGDHTSHGTPRPQHTSSDKGSLRVAYCPCPYLPPSQTLRSSGPSRSLSSTPLLMISSIMIITVLARFVSDH